MMKHRESLMMRGWFVPERAATEGQHGTKAEAGVAVDLVAMISMLFFQRMVDEKLTEPWAQRDIKPDDLMFIDDEEADALEQQILLLIDDSPKRIDWESIGGLDALKKELKFHYGLAMAKVPEGVRVEGWNNIMFYGPPGTGKTLLACAVANKLSATFFNVKASQIVSKWVGESGRLISTLYRVARKFTRDGRPSIIFIDEFDALCRSRGGEGQLYHQQMLAAILSE
ncbi:MAG: AAA family ATPase, partial [Nitrospinae bacterium]|nr:AAA family ATPase [Nitrospinota bacterium]